MVLLTDHVKKPADQGLKMIFTSDSLVYRQYGLCVSSGYTDSVTLPFLNQAVINIGTHRER